jgi:hypothetical protein
MDELEKSDVNVLLQREAEVVANYTRCGLRHFWVNPAA